MKLFTMILSAALAAGTLCAQTSDRINLRFPAPVVVNGVTLPAGEASIEVVHHNAISILNVRSENGMHASVLASLVEVPESDSGAKVVFDQKGGNCYLNEVVFSDGIAYQVFDGK